MSILVLYCLALSLFSGSFKHEVVRNNPSSRRNWFTLLTTFFAGNNLISVVQLCDHVFVSWNRKAMPSPANWTFFSAYYPGSCYLFKAARTGHPWRCKPLPCTGLGILKMWPRKMGDPSLAATVESHDASQEAQDVVMEAIIRRYYCFPLHYFVSSTIFRFLICVF
jgi:hypothetical protein